MNMKHIRSLLLVLATLAITSASSAAGGGSWTSWARRAWIPRDIPASTCVLDLWASTITNVAEDGAVSSVRDGSGTGNTGTGVASPTYKAAVLGALLRPIVRLNGSSQYVTAHGVASVVSGTDKPFTLIIAGKLRAVGAGAQMLAAWSRSSSSTPFLALAQETTKWETDHRDDASSRTLTQRQTSDTSAHVITVLYTGTAMSIEVDGAAGASDPVTDDKGAITVDQFSIGVWGLAGTFNTFAQLDFGRVYLFNTALSSTDRARVRTFISAYYGMP